MAKAIQTMALVPDAEQEEQAKKWQHVKQVAVENQDGVEQALQLLGLLQRKGIFDLCIGLLERSEEILEIALRQANQPGAVGGTRNFIALTQSFAHMDMTGIPLLLEGLGKGARLVEQQETVPIKGAWDMLKALRDPEVNKGLSTLLTLLKGFEQRGGAAE